MDNDWLQLSLSNVFTTVMIVLLTLISARDPHDIAATAFVTSEIRASTVHPLKSYAAFHSAAPIQTVLALALDCHPRCKPTSNALYPSTAVFEHPQDKSMTLSVMAIQNLRAE